MKEEQSGAYEDEESAKAVRPNFGALVYESEVVKAKGAVNTITALRLRRSPYAHSQDCSWRISSRLKPG